MEHRYSSREFCQGLWVSPGVAGYDREYSRSVQDTVVSLRRQIDLLSRALDG